MARPPSRRGASVRDDWRAWLPESKARLNDNCFKELETLYNILSVSLNEAIELRKKGAFVRAYEAVGVCRGICTRFSESLEVLLDRLHRHVKHSAVVPNVAPIDPANFQGSRQQRTVRLTGLLNRVLLSQRSQFIHKAATLKDMVFELQEEFCTIVDSMAAGIVHHAASLWDSLVQCHFDLNTCLQETVVLLKSFLLALPDEQLPAFEALLNLPAPRATTGKFSFRHRRFAAVPGK